jgi:hypothetical protein
MKLSIFAIGIGIFLCGYIVRTITNWNTLYIGLAGIVAMVALLIVENRKVKK